MELTVLTISFGDWQLNNSQPPAYFKYGELLPLLLFALVMKIYSSLVEGRQLSGLGMRLCEQKI